jgi:membrane protease subunit HflC
MSRRLLLLLLVPVGLIWGLSALYTVDQAEFAYVTRFGRLVALHDGGRDGAGLHVKWPWPVESVQRLDRRLQVFDLAPTESLTPVALTTADDPAGAAPDRGDRTIDRTLVVDAYVCWRIPDAAAVERFIGTVGTPERVRDLLGQRISSRLSTVISNMPLDELIQEVKVPGAPDDATAAERRRAVIEQRNERVRQRLLGLEPVNDAERRAGAEDVRAAVRAAYGIEVIDVRLRRFNYPEKVRPAIAERIISERKRRAAIYDSEGDRLAKDIRSKAERDAAIITAEARAERQRRERQADVDADRVRNEAHEKDREFYAFLQKLRAYQDIMARTSDVLLLSSKHEFFELLLKPPRSNGSTSNGLSGAATPREPTRSGGQ